MSVRVNLLPQTVAEKQAASRQRGGLILGGVALLAALGAVTFWQNGRIADAEDRRDDQQAVLTALRADEAQLAEFADLQGRVREADELIVAALGDEASFAGILQDVAAVMPSDGQLESLSIVLADVPTVGVDAAAVGTLTAVGKSLNAHAPGLERLLLEFDKVAAFHDLFFTSSVLEDPEQPYPTFSVEAQLGPEIRTERYAEGVPEGLR